jgi:hypothetical protein
MRLVLSTLTLAAVCGTISTAQPVARHLIDDADVLKVLHTEQSVATATRWASMHRLDDLDADGVDEILLTHVTATPGKGLFDLYRSSVVSPRTDAALLVLPPDEAKWIKRAHTAALMIDDIDADGVRDIAAARRLTQGIGLRVHSGATGEVLRDIVEDNVRNPWGLSLLPWEDIDGDGQPDLIASAVGNGYSGNYPYITWSPGADTAEYFVPDDYTPPPSMFQVGRTMLDLGVGATGAREFLSTLGTTVPSGPPQGRTYFFGGAPLGIRGSFYPDPQGSSHRPADGGAVRLGDLNNDGFREIVVTGRFADPNNAGRFGLPVLSGALPTSPSFGLVDPLSVHSPRIVVDIDGAPTTIEPEANHTVIPLGDATGDEFPDYALVGSMERYTVPDNFLSEYIVGVCGRTGRAFFAAHLEQAQSAPVQAQIIRLDTPGPPRARDSVISPGDINDDGAPDILALVHLADYAQSPPLNEQLLLTHYLPTPCAGDTDFDRAVDFNDLNTVLANFGAQDITSPADLNASGVVDFADLNLVLSAFGSTCD